MPIKSVKFLTFLLLINSSCIFAQDQKSWHALTNRSTEQFNKNEFVLALDASLVAYKLADANKDESQEIKSLTQLAWNFQALGRLSDAEDHSDRAISLELDNSSINRLSLSRELVLLARLQMLQKKWTEAKKTVTKAVRNIESTNSESGLDLSVPLSMLGEIAVKKMTTGVRQRYSIAQKR